MQVVENPKAFRAHILPDGKVIVSDQRLRASVVSVPMTKRRAERTADIWASPFSQVTDFLGRRTPLVSGARVVR